MATVKFQLRRDTAANWASVNPTLGAGEPAVETDTGKRKYGNGANAWNDLPYAVVGSADILDATTAGRALLTLANPSAVRFLRVNADNTVSALDAASFRTAIGAGTSSTTGTVTSVSGSGGTTGLSFTGGPITGSGTLTLSGTLALANGGTGSTTQAGARTALGLGSIATQAANSVALSGGAVTGLTTLTVGAAQVASTTSGTQFFSDVSLLGGGAEALYFNGYFHTVNGFVSHNAGYSGLIRYDVSAGVMAFYNSPSSVAAGAASGVGVRARLTYSEWTPGQDNALTNGSAALRWSQVYAATSTINTSDERLKADIGAIPDEWLDAWGDVDWRRYRFRDAIAAKGDDARWHLGLVAQAVHAAFATRGINAFAIGLLCYDKWDAIREPVIGKRGKPLKKTRALVKAGDRWGLRYEECFAMEAAYQRRRMDRIEARLAA